MGRRTSRSVFAVTLCAGVAMLGASAHGLVGVDAELQRSVLAVEQTIQEDQHSVRVSERHECWEPDTHKL